MSGLPVIREVSGGTAGSGQLIALYAFAPAFGLPSPGPFAIKTEVQLRMLGLPYRLIARGRDEAPKGKLPYIDDDGAIVADSLFIRLHLEESRGLDLDAGYDDAQRALAWSAERLVEDNLYWAMVHSRWAIDDNFAKGPARFFDALPAEIRDTARANQRAKVLSYLDGQGIGRHSEEEIGLIARLGYAALSRLLGDKPFLLGEEPCGADASIFGQVASALAPCFDFAVRAAAESQPNLVAYSGRMMRRYYPDFA